MAPGGTACKDITGFSERAKPAELTGQELGEEQTSTGYEASFKGWLCIAVWVGFLLSPI